MALGAALIGGTSAFGRRGGIFGTVLAVGLITLIDAYSDEAGLGWPSAALATVAILVGLAVTRLVERLGRPRTASEALDEDWVALGAIRSAARLADRSRAPATAATTPGGLWASDDAWGTADRR